MNKRTVKFISEFLPIILFFVAYKFYGLLIATGTIIIASIFGLVFTYIFHKRIPPLQLFTVALIIIFGGITLINKDPSFIKMKPTIINLCFALTLTFGLLNKKLYMQNLLGGKISMTDYGWRLLTKRFIAFFIAMAVTNEFIRNFLSENTWVYFKAFGLLAATILFLLFQISLFEKHKT